mmetsp:Transcript_6247/g.15949  ORF Transcript_6247/g.15949 Transcript_6247/m.15949 type:complete len:221 (+) Transcript_6247:822-1484(+)
MAMRAPSERRMVARVPMKEAHRGSLPSSLASCSERVRGSRSRSVNAACGQYHTRSLPSARTSSMSLSSFHCAESTIVLSLTRSGVFETSDMYRSRLRSMMQNLRSYSCPTWESSTSSTSITCVNSLHACLPVTQSRKRTMVGAERSTHAAASFEIESVCCDTNSGRSPGNLSCDMSRPSYENTCTPLRLSTVAKCFAVSLSIETDSLRSKMCGVFQLLTE